MYFHVVEAHGFVRGVNVTAHLKKLRDIALDYRLVDHLHTGLGYEFERGDEHILVVNDSPLNTGRFLFSLQISVVRLYDDKFDGLMFKLHNLVHVTGQRASEWGLTSIFPPYTLPAIVQERLHRLPIGQGEQKTFRGIILVYC